MDRAFIRHPFTTVLTYACSMPTAMVCAMNWKLRGARTTPRATSMRRPQRKTVHAQCWTSAGNVAGPAPWDASTARPATTMPKPTATTALVPIRKPTTAATVSASMMRTWTRCAMNLKSSDARRTKPATTIQPPRMPENVCTPRCTSIVPATASWTPTPMACATSLKSWAARTTWRATSTRRPQRKMAHAPPWTSAGNVADLAHWDASTATPATTMPKPTATTAHVPMPRNSLTVMVPASWIPMKMAFAMSWRSQGAPMSMLATTVWKQPKRTVLAHSQRSTSIAMAIA